MSSGIRHEDLGLPSVAAGSDRGFNPFGFWRRVFNDFVPRAMPHDLLCSAVRSSPHIRHPHHCSYTFMVCSLQANLPSSSVDLSKLGLFRSNIPLLAAQLLLLLELCKGDSDILGRPFVIPLQLLNIVLNLLLVSSVTVDLVLNDPEDGEDHEETG